MVGAIIIGAIVGVGSFAPLVFGAKLARKASPTSNLGHAGALLLGALISFIILAAAMVICALAFRDLLVPFALAEVAGILVFAVGYGFVKLVRK